MALAGSVASWAAVFVFVGCTANKGSLLRRAVPVRFAACGRSC